MARINMLEVYRGRLEEIEKQIRKMARTKKWDGYGALKGEKVELQKKIAAMEEKKQNEGIKL